MKKVFFLSLCFVLFVSLAAAEGINLSFSGAITTVKMTNVNENITALFDDASLLYPSWTKKNTPVTAGFSFGGQLSYETALGLAFDLRLEYVSPSDGVCSLENTATNSSFKETYSSNIVPILGGVSFNAYIPGTPINIGASAAAGYGFSNMLIQRKWVISGTTLVDEFINGYGGCFTYQGTGNLGYKFSKSMDIQLNIGYRSALVPEFKSYKSSSLYSAVQDQPIKTYPGTGTEVLAFDFTGMIFQLTITNKF